MKLFIANISFKLEEAELKQLLTQFGQVASIKLSTDKKTGRRKGYGFVEMPVAEQAQKAIDALNGKEIGGRAWAVSVSVDKEYLPVEQLEKRGWRQRIARKNPNTDDEEIDGNRWS